MRRSIALLAASALVTMTGCAELDGIVGGPSRENVSVSVPVASDAPPPPASLLELAGPPRPRPRAPATARVTPPVSASTPDQPAPAEVAPVPIAAAPPPAVGPERLLGLTDTSLEIWLGPPQQRLDAAPARVWRYVENECRLDAFLYLDLQTREFHVLHYEVATNDSSDQRKDECVRQILVRNGGPLPHPGPVQAENRPH